MAKISSVWWKSNISSWSGVSSCSGVGFRTNGIHMFCYILTLDELCWLLTSPQFYTLHDPVPPPSFSITTFQLPFLVQLFLLWVEDFFSLVSVFFNFVLSNFSTSVTSGLSDMVCGGCVWSEPVTYDPYCCGANGWLTLSSFQTHSCTPNITM